MMTDLRKTIIINECVIVGNYLLFSALSLRGTIDPCENKKKGAVEQSKMQLKSGIFPNLMVT